MNELNNSDLKLYIIFGLIFLIFILTITVLHIWPKSEDCPTCGVKGCLKGVGHRYSDRMMDESFIRIGLCKVCQQWHSKAWSMDDPEPKEWVRIERPKLA